MPSQTCSKSDFFFLIIILKRKGAVNPRNSPNWIKEIYTIQHPTLLKRKPCAKEQLVKIVLFGQFKK